MHQTFLALVVGGRKRLEIGPGLGRAIRGNVGKGRGAVPDQALDGSLDEDAVDVVVDRAETHQAGRVVGFVGGRIENIGEIDELAGGLVLGHLAGTRNAGHIGQVARLDALRELSVQVTGSGVLDLNSGLVDPGLDHGQERGLLIAGPGADDGETAGDWTLRRAGNDGRRGNGSRRADDIRRRRRGGRGRGGGRAACRGDEHRRYQQRQRPPRLEWNRLDRKHSNPPCLTGPRARLASSGSKRPHYERSETAVSDLLGDCCQPAAGPTDSRTLSSVSSKVRCGTGSPRSWASRRFPAVFPSA